MPPPRGNRDGRGAERYAHKGLLKRFVAAHYATVPALGAMALRNEMEAYNLSQGALCHLFRDIAAHKPGTITKVGLGVPSSTPGMAAARSMTSPLRTWWSC